MPDPVQWFQKILFAVVLNLKCQRRALPVPFGMDGWMDGSIMGQYAQMVDTRVPSCQNIK